MSDVDEAKVKSQRNFPRVSHSCPVNFRILESSEVDEGADAARAIMNNISGGGISFSSPDPLDVGNMLALEVDLPGYPSGVISMGKVVWCNPSTEESGRHDIGVEFWWVGWKDEDAQKRISNFIGDALDSDAIDED